MTAAFSAADQRRRRADPVGTAALDRQAYALQLTDLDQCLRNLGRDGEVSRGLLKSYTAAVIASTWLSEPRPAGVDYPDTSNMPRIGTSPVLANLMNRIDLELRHMQPAGAFQASIRQNCLEIFRDVARVRLLVIESVSRKISLPFQGILVFWLMIVFATFGLAAPRNSLSLIGMVLCAVSLSSALFAIADLGPALWRPVRHHQRRHACGPRANDGSRVVMPVENGS